jgi:hypothetical protein
MLPVADHEHAVGRAARLGLQTGQGVGLNQVAVAVLLCRAGAGLVGQRGPNFDADHLESNGHRRQKRAGVAADVDHGGVGASGMTTASAGAGLRLMAWLRNHFSPLLVRHSTGRARSRR